MVLQMNDSDEEVVRRGSFMDVADTVLAEYSKGQESRIEASKQPKKTTFREQVHEVPSRPLHLHPMRPKPRATMLSIPLERLASPESFSFARIHRSVSMKCRV